MATSLTLQNDASLAQGYVKVNGTTSATFTTSGITGNLVGNVTGNVTGSLTAGGSLTLATAQTATGLNAVDFTGIPSWVKRITVMFAGTSLTGTSQHLVQIGDSAGFETSGYVSGSAVARDNLATLGGTSTSGFIIFQGNTASNIFNGTLILNYVGFNSWCASITGNNFDTGISGGGTKTLTSTLDRIRITTVNGSNFDAGTINISYEG
jgi:hypothetical protein